MKYIGNERIFIKRKQFVGTIMIFLIIGLCLGGVVAFGIIESEKTDACFSKDELSFDCEYTNNGNFEPLIENNKKYWTCTTMDYKVRAC